jgi:hypothetical protein
MAGPAFPWLSTMKVSMVFEPPSSTTSTPPSLPNWICRGTSAPAPSGCTDPRIGRSLSSLSRKPAIVFDPALSA